MKRWTPGANTALVTHKGCLDGTGSALMFLWAGGRRENILFRNPSSCNLTPDESVRFDEVWFADLCPKSRGQLNLSDSDVAGGKPFHVFDHHISNARLYADDPSCTFSMTHSGTTLLGEMMGLYDSSSPDLDSTTLQRLRLATALQAYDLGRFDHDDGIFLADLAASFSQDEMLDVLLEHGSMIFEQPSYRGRAEALASMRGLYAESITKVIVQRDLDGISCGVAFSPVYWKNDVAQRILSRGFSLAVVIDPSGMVSLRSLPGGPDCSMIAGRYGGGGHSCAAGFKCNFTQMAGAAFDEVFG